MFSSDILFSPRLLFCAPLLIGPGLPLLRLLETHLRLAGPLEAHLRFAGHFELHVRFSRFEAHLRLLPLDIHPCLLLRSCAPSDNRLFIRLLNLHLRLAARDFDIRLGHRYRYIWLRHPNDDFRLGLLDGDPRLRHLHANGRLGLPDEDLRPALLHVHLRLRLRVGYLGRALLDRDPWFGLLDHDALLIRLILLLTRCAGSLFSGLLLVEFAQGSLGLSEILRAPL
ncbi:hypothetical protein J2Z31_000919 [Sinorhizobium kostiense]|uniref:Uncharacterized protein n=1 Tax=Sinorhizobium kostiense TaxID=76747 RepID=A0ABS4QUW1_9HYPH|nr:hypothetical protein [Sinorhizobium kostiense]MBP2234429.1 hypothetical protein [Sinorhizobium kostiense]